ncbi:MAG: sugar ABC transporter permease YjfF [Treponema sp.]|nr:sugar ABC transporter permease YjfF [Treponema sp.]MCR5621439.1 sugar ABC transporter permease YjfF [Treponema sp.]
MKSKKNTNETALAADQKKKGKIDSSNFLLFITVCLFLIMYIFGCLIYGDAGFGRRQVLLNMLIDNAGLLIAASGMTMVMITGGIDISVGSVIGLSCMILSYCMEKKGFSASASVAIVLSLGVLFGIFQGWLISYMELQPFIITLAGLFGCRGLTAMLSTEQIAITDANAGGRAFIAVANKNIYFRTGSDENPGIEFIDWLLGATQNKRGVVSYPFVHPSVLIAIAVVVIIWFVLKYTKFGRNLYAIGGNEQSALLMGINVKRNKFVAYVVEGFMAALAGTVFCLNTTSGFVEQARGFEMEAISSAVIGGTMLTGGVGSIVGTFFGVLIKATIETLIRSQGTLSSWWNKIVLSIILCFFIVLQSVFIIIKNRKKS